QEKSDRAYMAPTGAVSLNWNAVGVYLRPGEKSGAKAAGEGEPPSDYFVIEKHLSTGGRFHPRSSISLEQMGEKQRITARGVVPQERGSISVWKKIDNPPFYFGQTLKRMLAERGIKTKGRVKLGAVPARAKMLYVAQSETFDLILKRMNKV